MKRFFIGLIRVYQWTIGAFFGGRCRFLPTCSDYGVLAIERHGALRGSLLTAKRIARCHPFADGGVVDFPPPPALRDCEKPNG